MHTVTVSIGREVPPYEHSAPSIDGSRIISRTRNDLWSEEWYEFVRRTSDAVRLWADQIHFTGEGTGTYVNEAGDTITEDSYTIIASVSHIGHLSTLAFQLGNLATEYQQEAIAFTIGSTTFVGPNARHEPF